MLKRLRILLATVPLLVALPLSLTAQGSYTFSRSVTFSGDCSSSQTAMLHKGVISAFIEQAPKPVFNSLMECESSRAYNTWTSTDSGCTARVFCSPCVRIGGGLTSGDLSYLGNYQLLGPDQGMNSFSTNPADDVEHWDEDWARKRDMITTANNSTALPHLLTGDPSFDREYASLIKGGDRILSINSKVPPKGRGVPVSDDFLNKPFKSLDMREPWSSDDLSNVDKLPALPPATGYRYERPEHPWMEWGADLLKDGLDIGFMFVKGAGFTASILMEANVNLYRELIECVMDQCTDANDIFKRAWNVDFKALAKKVPEVFSNVNMFVPAGSVGVPIPHQSAQDDQKIFPDTWKAAEYTADKAVGEGLDKAKEITNDKLLKKFKFSDDVSQELLEEAKYIGATVKAYKLAIKLIDGPPQPVEE